MTEEANLKIKSRYQFDQFLMYLIQDVTKKPSAEILNFFYELATQVSQMGFKAKKGGGGGIDKQIDDYFPGTSIPFHMRIKGSQRNYEYVNGQYTNNKGYFANVEVGFPTQNTYFDEAKLSAAAVAIMEQHLLGGDGADLPPFEKPAYRASKMYKGLMDSFAGRPPPEKKPRKRKIKGTEDGSNNQSNQET